MSRRLTTIVLAAFYLLQATWLLHAGVDFLFPRLQQIAAGPDACCTRTCGCPEEVQRNNACCCAKDVAETVVDPTPRPVSSIEEARCRGVEAAMTQAFTQPVVCGFGDLTFPVIAVAGVVLPDLQPELPPLAAALDKVPIAQA